MKRAALSRVELLIVAAVVSFMLLALGLSYRANSRPIISDRPSVERRKVNDGLYYMVDEIEHNGSKYLIVIGTSSQYNVAIVKQP